MTLSLRPEAMAGRRAPSIVRSFSDFGNTSLKISLFFYHDRAPVMLHPCDHPLGLLQRRRHHAKPADGGDSRGEGLDEVSPGLEKAAAPFFVPSPPPSSLTLFFFFFFSFASSFCASSDVRKDPCSLPSR